MRKKIIFLIVSSLLFLSFNNYVFSFNAEKVSKVLFNNGETFINKGNTNKEGKCKLTTQEKYYIFNRPIEIIMRGHFKGGKTIKGIFERDKKLKTKRGKIARKIQNYMNKFENYLYVDQLEEKYNNIANYYDKYSNNLTKGLIKGNNIKLSKDMKSTKSEVIHDLICYHKYNSPKYGENLDKKYIEYKKKKKLIKRDLLFVYVSIIYPKTYKEFIEREFGEYNIIYSNNYLIKDIISNVKKGNKLGKEIKNNIFKIY